MEFHPGKCQVIHFTRSSKPQNYTYTLHNQPLEAVSSAKYLGITLSSNLSWKPHISAITSKANRSLGFLKRNVQVNSPSYKEKLTLAWFDPRLSMLLLCGTHITKPMYILQKWSSAGLQGGYSTGITTRLVLLACSRTLDGPLYKNAGTKLELQ